MCRSTIGGTGGASSTTNGAQNTSNIVASIGTSTTYAARACSDNTSGGGAAGSWYLPAICEWGTGSGCNTSGVANIYDNLVALGFGGFNNNIFFSSTEVNLANAWSERILDDSQLSIQKGFNNSVRCARAITY